MDKPGSWFLLAKCLKNTSGRVTLSKDAGHRLGEQPGFYISRTLVENGLINVSNIHFSILKYLCSRLFIFIHSAYELENDIVNIIS